MPDQGSPKFEPGSLIVPGGPALLHVLEPGYVISMNHWPPEGLTILDHLLQMNGHFISKDIHLESHDGRVSIHKGHAGHDVVDGRLTLRCENQLIGPENLF